MNYSNILFFNEDIKSNIADYKSIAKWIHNTIISEKKILKHINIIFCTDEYLNSINNNHLKHDTYTDVITFDNSEETNIINGDIYISVERVRENAVKYFEDYDTEVKRVIIHGILHLIGYDDRDEKQKIKMCEKENEYLAKF